MADLVFRGRQLLARLPGLVTGLVFLAIWAQLLIVGVVADRYQ